MPRADEVMQTYEDLAQVYDRQGQAKLRDWFLVLAADAAYNAGWEEEAERLRHRLLTHNPHHLLKPFANFVEALKSPDIQSYINDLRRTYPPETAGQLLDNQKPAGAAAVNFPAPGPAKVEFDVGSFDPPNGHAPREEPRVYKLANVPEEPRPAPPPPRPPSPARLTQPLPAPRPTPPAQALTPQPIVAPRPAAPAPVPPARPAPLPTPTRVAQTPVRNPLAEPPPRPAVALTPTSTAAAPQPLTLPKPKPDVKAPPDYPVSRWVCGFLYLLVALSAAAVTAYTFGKPFVPADWLP